MSDDFGDPYSQTKALLYLLNAVVGSLLAQSGYCVLGLLDVILDGCL